MENESIEINNPEWNPKEQGLTFEKELEGLINKYSKENDSDTPDFILAQYLSVCMYNYNQAVQARDKWFGVKMWDVKQLQKL